jgi:hypothetical protein
VETRLEEVEASLGESPLWPTAAIITAPVLYADLPTRFIAGDSVMVVARAVNILK